MLLSKKKPRVTLGNHPGHTFPLVPNNNALHGPCVNDPQDPDRKGKDTLSSRIQRIRVTDEGVIAETRLKEFLLVDVPVERAEELATLARVELVQ
jgi:hypothetical protein